MTSSVSKDLEAEIHVITDDLDNPEETMAERSKPPTAEEIRAILNEGLSKVARREDIKQVMVHVDRNAGAINSINARLNDLEGQIRSTNGGQEDRFRDLEMKIDHRSGDYQ